MGEDLEIIQEVAFADINMIPLLRGQIDETKLAGKIRSIEEVGLLCPPRLTRQGDKFVPVDGYHRLLALMKLGRKSAPAIIEEKPLTEGAMLQKGLIADAHHSELTSTEKAEGIARLMQITGWNASAVAEKLGLSNATVSRLLALLQLPEPIREKVHRGEIAASAATQLVDVADGEEQQLLAEQLADGTLTRDRLIGKLKAARKNGQAKAPRRAGRIVARLDSERTVTVVADAMDIDAFIETLEELLGKARKARTQGVEVATFAKMLSDQAKAGS
jgi:ParB/RepB/Spo0J family partition protein